MTYPNLLIIAGAGRNCGKTTIACQIIKKLSQTHSVVGVKISPHFHKLNDNDKIIYENENYTVVEEINNTSKDSSLLLQSGAKQSFYIQAYDTAVAEAFAIVSERIDSKSLIVCESGGLGKYITPGLLLFVEGTESKNAEVKEIADVCVKLENFTVEDIVSDGEVISFR